MRKARPESVRFTFFDSARNGVPLDLPDRRTWPVGLLFGVFFAIFAAIAVVQIRGTASIEVKDTFDLAFVVFGAFWVLGWSVGVAILGLLTVLFLFYDESARIENGRLVHVPRLGPLKVVCEFDLASISNLRLEPAKDGKAARVRFDYANGKAGIGDAMPPERAQAIVETIGKAMPMSAGAFVETEPRSGRVPEEATEARAERAHKGRDLPAGEKSRWAWLKEPSSLALVAANVLPLAGVLAFGWKLSDVMVLYWAESAVIAFYTILKMFVVAKIIAIFPAVFFLGHFGGFMAAHFMFVYALFVRGLDAKGADLPAGEALTGIFGPIWPALLAVAVSHGVSFALNFIGRREYAGSSIGALMSAPYKRIVVMHLTVIFGGWLVMLSGTPAPALALLVLLKTAADIRGHVREHRRA